MSKQVIMDRAFESFGRDGYAETTLKSIATKAGIKAPSIYAHFASKEELFLAVYEQAFEAHDEFFAQLARSTADATPIERLHRLLMGISLYYREHPDLFDFHLRSLIAQPMNDMPVKRVFMSSDETLTALITDAYIAGCAERSFTPGDPEAFSALFLTLMDGAFLQLKHYSPDEAQRRLELTWEQLKAMLSTHQEGPK